MSEIKLKLDQDLKTAMKAREQHKVTTLRCVLAAVKQYEIDSRSMASDEQVAIIIQQEVRKRRDALKYAEQQNREDLIAQNNEELKILMTYIGAPLGEAELRELIAGLIDGGANALGVIMKELNAKYKGRFDGKLASMIAGELLKK